MKNIASILNIFNYFDSIIVTNSKGEIEYYANMKQDLFDLKMGDVRGKTIMELHPYISEEESSIMRVLKTGKPIYDQIEYLTNKQGQELTQIYSTIPLISDGEIKGAIDFGRVVGESERVGIEFSLKGEDYLESLYEVDDIITRNKKMNEIKNKILRVANTSSTVFIYGETGTGKELIAQSLHSHGNRSKNKFISQNCAAIPYTLLESILFGTVKGSYTGAEDRKGLFEVADGGTLFLDEIHSMDLNMQSKILRVIEEKEISRVGSTEVIPVDVRIIAATNINPDKLLKDKFIREDLFYRLNVVQFEIPPLTERREDIMFLTNYFISNYNLRMNKKVISLDDEAKEIFISYDWPGNIRELKNVIEGAFNMVSSNYIKIKDIPMYLKDRVIDNKLIVGDKIFLNKMVEDYEKRIINEALSLKNSYTEVANLLGISKQALDYKLKKYKLK